MLKPLLALALIFTACNIEPGPDPKPIPVDPNPARIVHTGKNLVLYPGESLTESLYVAGKEASEWRVELKNKPSWASYSSGLIWYRIPEGLSGPQQVQAIAIRNGAVAIESSWTVTAIPFGNRAPKMAPVEIPAWIVGGTKLKIVFHAQDPDGDPIKFIGQTLPMGATLKDSILEWSPPAGQRVSGQFNIQASDGRNGLDGKYFIVASMAYDPSPYAAEPVMGRSWWIRGFHATSRSGKPADSVRVRRRITVTSRDQAAHTFAFRVIDTVGDANSSSRDTVFTASSRAGFGYVPGSPGEGDVPFAWLTDTVALEDRTFVLQGVSQPAKRVSVPHDCTPVIPGTHGGSCWSYESIFAEGMGLMSRENTMVTQFSQDGIHDSLAVWAISGP